MGSLLTVAEVVESGAKSAAERVGETLMPKAATRSTRLPYAAVKDMGYIDDADGTLPAEMTVGSPPGLVPFTN